MVKLRHQLLDGEPKDSTHFYSCMLQVTLRWMPRYLDVLFPSDNPQWKSATNRANRAHTHTDSDLSFVVTFGTHLPRLTHTECNALPLHWSSIGGPVPVPVAGAESTCSRWAGWAAQMQFAYAWDCGRHFCKCKRCKWQKPGSAQWLRHANKQHVQGRPKA